MPIQLNPCRNCGGKARRLTPKQADDDEGYYYVECRKLCGWGSSWAKSADEAAQVWNHDNPLSSSTEAD